MMAPNKTAALAWLGAQPGGAPLAVGMAGLTDLQFKGLQLWLINLLPTWGSLVYNSWLTQGGGGLLTTRPVYDLLYGEGSSCWVRWASKGGVRANRGWQRQHTSSFRPPPFTARSADPTATCAGYEDPVLLAAAQGGDPQNFRLSPWLFTPGLSVAFPTKEWPLEYFTNGEQGGPTYQVSRRLPCVSAMSPRPNSGGVEQQPACMSHHEVGRGDLAHILHAPVLLRSGLLQ